MNITKKVIYWYRLGLKVYNIDQNTSPTLEKEINSTEIEEIKTELKYLSGNSVFLLLDDEIGYLYEKIIDPPLVVDNQFKSKLSNIIQSDIPEDFLNFVWDYKIESDSKGKQKVLIFAPVKEFQTLISEVANSLKIKIEVIEIKSIASTRDSNPILGIIKKTDIGNKDEESLNLSIIPKFIKTKMSIKKIGLLIIIILILISIVLLIIRLKSQVFQIPLPSSNIITTTITNEPSPTLLPTSVPSSLPIKDWSNLIVMVQNGTTQAGLASKTAKILKDSGINQVDIANADNSSYTSAKLIFKDDLLKETYQNKFKSLVVINNNDVSIDNTIKFDVIFITVLN
jgi:hypothetical protein